MQASHLSSLCLARLMALAALGLAWCPLRTLAQEPGEAFTPYPVHHARAGDLERQVAPLLGASAPGAELLLDEKQNRLLLRGPRATHQLMCDLLDRLDRPAGQLFNHTSPGAFSSAVPLGAYQPIVPLGSVPGGQGIAPVAQASGEAPLAASADQSPVLRTYNYPAEQLAERAAAWQQALARYPGARVASDARTGQVLVVALPEVHDAVAAQLAPRPTTAESSSGQSSALPSGAPPGKAVPQSPADLPQLPGSVGATVHEELVLRQSRAEPVEAALAKLFGDRLHRLPNGTSDETGQADVLHHWQLTVPGDADLRLIIDPARQRVELAGSRTAVERGRRLIQWLDSPASDATQSTRALPIAARQEASIRKAVEALGAQVRDLITAARAATSTAAAPAVPVKPSSAASATPRTSAVRGIPLVAQLFQMPRTGGRVVAPNALAQAPAQPDPSQPNAEPPVANPPAVANPANPAAGGNDGTEALVGPVQIEFLEGLDVMIISGNQRDVDRVLRIIDDIERLSQETEPQIEIYPLKYTGSEQIATIANQLYGQVLSARQGQISITALAKPNALLLIGRAESIKTFTDLVARLDQPVGPATQFAVFELQHAPAAAAQATIQEFFASRGVMGTRLLVTADFRTNALIIQASPRDLAEVAELIRRLDAPTSQAVNELRVIPLQNSLAEELAPVLQEAITQSAGTQSGRRQGGGGGGGGGQGQGLFDVIAGSQAGGQTGGQGISQGGQGGAGQGFTAPTGGTSNQALQAKSYMLRFTTIDAQGQRKLRSGLLTDVRITADPRANALLVSAPAESLDLIEALVRQLDQIPAAEAQIKVFTIVNGDAANLSSMLQALFGQQSTTGGGGFGGNQQQVANISGETPLVPLRLSVDSRTNSIIASGSAGDLNVVEAILLRLDDSDVRQRQSVVYRLKNSPANDVALAVNDFLRSEREVQQINPGLLSPFEQIEREVVVVPEPVSNSLIVSATPRYFEEIRKIVEDLDARPPMVLIQVLIAEVALNNTDEFGVELGLQDSLLFDRSLLADIFSITNSTTQSVAGGGTITANNQQIVSATNTPGFAFNNQALGNSGAASALTRSNRVAGQALSNFSVGRVNGDLGFGGLVLSASSENVSILIRALKECRRLDVLSRPQVMTLDNQPAFIQVGSRVPRVQGVTFTATGQTSEVVDTNVGLILGVTPRISPDGLVVMEVDAERSSLGPEAEGVPISTSNTGEVVRQPVINTTTAQTTISALNGQTVILGGLITKTKAVTRRRVPVLASIPVLGNLFRYDAESTERTELLIILTPHVVRNEADADYVKQVEAARMNWCLADVQKIHGDAGLRNRSDDWGSEVITIINPDEQPTAVELVPTPDTLPQPYGSTAPGMQPHNGPMMQGPALPDNGAALPPTAQPPGSLPTITAPPAVNPPAIFPQGSMPPGTILPGAVPPAAPVGVASSLQRPVLPQLTSAATGAPVPGTTALRTAEPVLVPVARSGPSAAVVPPPHEFRSSPQSVAGGSAEAPPRSILRPVESAAVMPAGSSPNAAGGVQPLSYLPPTAAPGAMPIAPQEPRPAVSLAPAYLPVDHQPSAAHALYTTSGQPMPGMASPTSPYPPQPLTQQAYPSGMPSGPAVPTAPPGLFRP